MKKIYILIVIICSVCFTSCENEPPEITQGNLDFLDEEALDYMNTIATIPSDSVPCIRFNYSFTIFTYNENMELKAAESVFNNEGFIFLLDNLNPAYSISLNYPISGTLEDGTLLEITTNDELKEALNVCAKEEKRRRCNNTLIECIWSVIPVPESPNNFEDTAYKIHYNGTVQFYFDSEVYFGTWVTLYIGEDLYLNIDLNDNEEIEAFWNHNWRVEEFNTQLITLNNDTQQVSIKKDCTIPCLPEGYQVCEVEDMPGTALFDLENYIPCLATPFDHDIISSIQYSFFETEEEAMNNTNAIDATNYTNTTSPQILFVRIAYTNDDELIEVISLTIEAVSCTG